MVMLGTLVFVGGSVFAQAASSVSVSSSMEERIAQSKATLKLQLSTAQNQKIAQKCSAAQTIIKNVEASYKISADKRQQVYTDLSTQITTDIRKLQSQGEDIISLKAAQEQFDASISYYLADTSTYKTALDDIVNMDCAKDPLGFESVLTNARQIKTKLAADAAQIKKSRDVLVQVLAQTAKTLNSTARPN